MTHPMEHPGESSSGGVPDCAAAPQFGAVDIVEAFTALRHEWRGQTRETRAVGEQIQAAAASLGSLEQKLQSLLETRPQRDASDSETAPLVNVIIEAEHQFSRAVAAVSQWEETRRARELAATAAIDASLAKVNWLARWLARPQLQVLAALRGPAAEGSPALEGLNMVLARLRRMMVEQTIERRDVQGLPFDATLMHAIASVVAPNVPPGHVSEQFSAAYFWKGRLLRFAEVRVSIAPPAADCQN